MVMEWPPSPPTMSPLDWLGDKGGTLQAQEHFPGRQLSSVSFLPVISPFPNLQARISCSLCREKKKKGTATSPPAGSIFWGFIPDTIINHPRLRPWASILPTAHNWQRPSCWPLKHREIHLGAFVGAPLPPSSLSPLGYTPMTLVPNSIRKRKARSHTWFPVRAQLQGSAQRAFPILSCCLSLIPMTRGDRQKKGCSVGQEGPPEPQDAPQHRLLQLLCALIHWPYLESTSACPLGADTSWLRQGGGGGELWESWAQSTRPPEGRGLCRESPQCPCPLEDTD